MPRARDAIVLSGAHENNLKHISLSIPKGKLVVFTGVSGSGKSSLVFDTIAVEAARQLNDTYPLYLRSRLPHYEMPAVDMIDGLTTSIVIDQKPFHGDIRSTVATMTDLAPLLRLLFSRCGTPSAGPSSAYSFNDPSGMCPACSGLGKTVRFDFAKLLDTEKSLSEGAILFPGHQVGAYQWQLYANSGLLDPDKPLVQWSEREWQDFLHGSGVIVPIRNTTGKVWNDYTLTYEGFLDRIERLYLKRDVNAGSKAAQRILRDFTTECDCPACHGARLNAAALESRLLGYNIHELGEMEIGDLSAVLEGLENPVGASLARRLVRVLHSITDMGLGYLSLNRPCRTLSGGEAQRLKMVRHLGSSLTGLTYIFDEPSAGLHPADVKRLGRLLLRLRDRGNTLLVVEHNKAVIRMADEVIDMGPAAGTGGGRVIFQGPVGALMEQDSLTGLSLRKKTPLNPCPRKPKGWLHIRNATLHNLKNVSVDIPLGVLTVVSGLAGSGKTSLVCGELKRLYPQAEHISSAPIGASSRSTPATYLGIMDEIRRLFARENGVDAALFSYSSKGACPVCKGKGFVTTEMAFMDPVTQPCEACRGTRFSEEALSHRFGGKTILEVLELTVDEAMEFFISPKIRAKLRVLASVGLGYLTLGQPTGTLSGGECQRVKLASHLGGKGGVLLLDEPATGLHGADVEQLMQLLARLIEEGASAIVVEHDLDVIRRADWVIDMGPEGGKNGGQVLYEGPPEGLVHCPHSATARALRREDRPLETD